MSLLAMARHATKQLIAPLLAWSGYADRKLDQLVNAENRLLILMYHRVVDDASADPFRLGMCVTRQTFEAQIRHFRQHFHLVGLDDALARVKAGDPLPRRAVAITFDDGYRDNLTAAAPILQRYQAPATFYVVTGELDSGRAFWWDRVIAAVARSRQPRVEAAGLGLPDLPPVLPLSSLRQASTLQTLLDAIWDLAPAHIETVVTALERQLDPFTDPVLATPRLTAREVARLAAAGFAIGGHTIHHADPRTLSQEQLRNELVQSRADLERVAQVPVRSFAYPAGRMSNGMPELVEAAGFEHAVSTQRGINAVPFSRFALARVGMPDTPIADFKRAIRNIPVLSAANGPVAVDLARRVAAR